MLKRILAGAAAAALSLLVVGPTTASAQSALSAHSARSTPSARTVNLSRAFHAALPHVNLGKIGGIAYGRGTRPHAAKTPGRSGCLEPNCPLPYNGGPVQHSPRVYLLLWGPNWSSEPAEEASASYLESFYSGLGGSGDTWSLLTSPYGDSHGYPEFSKPVYMGVWQDTANTEPAYPGQSDIAAEADAFASSQGITDLADAQIVVASESGICPQGFYAPCNGSNGYYCAWHSISNEPYTNLPYLPDANDVGGGPGSGCGANVVSSVNDGFSIVGGHEYGETVTDPVVGSGWWDPSDNSGGENGDKCAWIDPTTGNSDIADVTLSTGVFPVQPLFSNLALGLTGDGCSWLGGVSGNRVRGVHGRCLDNFHGRFTAGNKADVWKCTGANGQFWTPIAGMLFNNGRCLSDPRSGRAGTKLVLSVCKDKRYQRWAHKKNGEYVLKANGLCLTDPNNATRNGSKVTVAKCRNRANQHWSQA